MRKIAESPLRTFLALVSVSAVAYVTFAPLWAARYPPMTDLPFHAAHTSIFRHYWDPSWHFHEQFVLQPLAVPYVLHYALGAALMLVLPVVPAVKAATGIMLLMLPLGMAVLLHGMKKSPMGALFAAPFAYCALSHWGFVSHVAALGLFAMAVGLAMLVLDRPTLARQVGLAVSLVLLFFSHIFRFPMGFVAVIGTVLFLYPATRRVRPVVWPMLPSLFLFVIWLFVRPATLEASDLVFQLDLGRYREIREVVFGGFADPRESEVLWMVARVGGLVALACLFAAVVEGDDSSSTKGRFAVGAWVVAASATLVLLGLYFTLPMQIGTWWYVYPREATAALFVGIAVLPGLPKKMVVRAPLVLALALSSVLYGRYVAEKYAEFDVETRDFERITSELPRAPKLLYLIHDHSGSSRNVTPFVHLPAWAQAEHGGWLSFNFASFGAAPMAFRSADDPIAVVPPPMPIRWEWNAHPFRVKKHGAFFDWFLVRARSEPDAYFYEDPDIEQVAHSGKWWLYRRFPPRQ